MLFVKQKTEYEIEYGFGGWEMGKRDRVFSGTSPDGSLVEFVDLPADVHPYYVSTQAPPEFLSRPNRAHPLFAGLVGAALDRQRGERLVEVEVD